MRETGAGSIAAWNVHRRAAVNLQLELNRCLVDYVQ